MTVLKGYLKLSFLYRQAQLIYWNQEESLKLQLSISYSFSLSSKWFYLATLSRLFDISIPSASRYIITWTNFLYFQLGNDTFWPTLEQVDEYMPESFRRAYPSTRCIIDCTELYCQRPSSLSRQSALYLSHVEESRDLQRFDWCFSQRIGNLH